MTSTSGPEHFFRAATLAAMVGCIALSLVALIEMFVPGWDGTYVVIFCVLTAVEAYCAVRLLHGDLFSPGEGLRFRLAELVALFLCLQLCVDVESGYPPLHDFIPRLDWKTAGLFLLVFISWLVASDTTRDLDELGASAQGTLGFIPPERRVTARFFLGGVVIFVAAALSQVNIAQAIKLSASGTSGPVLNVPVYFLLGIVLLEHVHYSTLRSRWTVQGISMARGLASRWRRYSLVFVGAVALLALLLPTTHTIGLLDIGRTVWGPISTLLAKIILAIEGPLTRFLQLFGGGHVKPPRVPPQPLPRLRPHHAVKSSPAPGSWVALLKSIVFWGIVAASAVYLLRTYLSHAHLRIPLIGGALSAGRRLLSRAWSALLSLMHGYADLAVSYLAGGVVIRAPGRPEAGRRLRFTRIGSLSPREQVLYYYLNIVRRATRRGFPRGGSQTPREYSAALAPRLPEAGDDMESLTAAFVQARYSRHSVEPADIGPVRAGWQRVRAALRHLAR